MERQAHQAGRICTLQADGGDAHAVSLWLFEGFTSYYDDLMLLRSGLIDEAAYFSLLEKTINGVLRGSGRSGQSVAESSFDAWTKYYRQDENSPNAIVSYYAKGALVALAFDLTIRADSAGKKSLDDVMRALWTGYGRDFYNDATDGSSRRGVTEAEVEALFDAVSGMKLKRLFERWVRGTDDLPLAKLLAPFGVTLTDDRKDAKANLGARVVRDGGDCRLANVYEDGAAHRAGLSANDLLVAINGLRVAATNAGLNLETLLARYRSGDTVEVHAFRRDELMRFDVRLTPDAAACTRLRADAKPAVAARLRQRWLKG